MGYQGGNRRYNGGGQRYSGGNGGGHRPRRPQNGYQQQGGYGPNKASLRPNHEKRKDTDRDYMGVVTILDPGVYFISGWDNEYEDGNRAISLRLTHSDPDIAERHKQEAGQGGQRNGGGYQQRGNGGGQRPQQRQRQEPRGNGGYDDNRAYQEGGAMTRARPIPEVRYDDSGPYDNGPGPDNYDISYDHEKVPF